MQHKWLSTHSTTGHYAQKINVNIIAILPLSRQLRGTMVFQRRINAAAIASPDRLAAPNERAITAALRERGHGAYIAQPYCCVNLRCLPDQCSSTEQVPAGCATLIASKRHGLAGMLELVSMHVPAILLINILHQRLPAHSARTRLGSSPRTILMSTIQSMIVIIRLPVTAWVKAHRSMFRVPLVPHCFG